MKVQKQLSTSFLIICHRKLILMTSKPNGSYGDRQQTWNLEPVDLTRTNHSVTPAHSVKVEPTVLVQFKSRAVREKVTRGRKIVKSLPCSIAEDLTTVNLQILNRFNKILIAWKKPGHGTGNYFDFLIDNTKILLPPFQAWGLLCMQLIVDSW